MIVIRLGAPRKAPVDDPFGRLELGFRENLSESDYWSRAQGPWRLDERRALSESYVVVVDGESTILAVAQITGITKHGSLRALSGAVISGHPLVGRKCPFKSSSRNSIAYFDDIPLLSVHTGEYRARVEGSKKPLEAPLKVISLFSGAGGLDLGFADESAFDLLACVEFDEACCETLRANQAAGRLGNAHTRIIQEDISKLDPADLMNELGVETGEVDLVIGGPPCQSWSTTGKRGTAQDARGMLIWHFLRFVEVIQPEYFLMENVRGILSAAFKHRPIALRPERGGDPLQDEEKPGSAIRIWLDDATSMLDGLYRVDYYEVNSVNYGAPEIRERVLFFGNKRCQQIVFPEPTFGPDSADGRPYRTLMDAIGNLHEEPSEMQVLDFSPRKKRFLSYVPEGGNWRAMPEEIQKESMGRAFYAKGGRSGWWRRLSWDLPSPTIVTMPNHASTALCHPIETRALSVRECACIQEFPPDWEFVGTTSEQMRQVGNAVPVRLAKVAGELILKASKETPGVLPDQLPKWTHRYIASMVRTRQWFKKGTVFVRNSEGDVPLREA